MQFQNTLSGNTQRKKTLYQKNSMYGTNLSQIQMQQMENQKKKATTTITTETKNTATTQKRATTSTK